MPIYGNIWWLEMQNMNRNDAIEVKVFEDAKKLWEIFSLFRYLPFAAYSLQLTIIMYPNVIKRNYWLTTDKIGTE